MTFTLSKKDFVYGATISILLVATSASFTAYKANLIKSNENRVKSELISSETDSAIQEEVTQLNGDLPFPASSFPHANCYYKLYYTAPVSNVYNPDSPYNFSFVRASSGPYFQDINGDNLVDYVWVHSTSDGADTIHSTYTSCVYLNNGNGWTKAYECIATTDVQASTGQISNAEYRGDCAGEPNKEN